MDMEYRLPGLAIGVEYGPESFGRQAAFRGDYRRPAHHLAHERIVSGLKIVQRLDVPLRDDEHVGWRLRVDVVEGQHAVVLVDDRCRNLASDQLAEEAIGHVTPFRA